MKRFLTALSVVLTVGILFAAKMSLTDARRQIGECIKDPAQMAKVIKQLAPADQITFLAEVNDAITKMPGSNESKTATFLNVDRAALSAAAPGNKTAMFAEVFATVPPESLTVLNERFASDLLNRAADPSKTYTDEQFTKIALNMMKVINERCATAENGAVRSSFAILMLVRASNGSPASLGETLIETLPETAQTAARSEWLPAAMGEKQTKTYEPMLGSADNVIELPANDVVMRLAGPQLLEAMLGDIVEAVPLVNNSTKDEIHTTPVRDEEDAPQPEANPSKDPINGENEPNGYQYQD